MRRYRKGQRFRPPTAAESAATVDGIETIRRHPAKPQEVIPEGEDIIVKTPIGGIPARSGLTIVAKECIICIETGDDADEKTIVETDETIYVFNVYPDAVAEEVYVVTSLTAYGTRYVSGEPC
jgi:hypothetical protein